MRGKVIAGIVVVLLLGPARALLPSVLAPMTTEALLIVAVGMGLFVWWLGSLYDRERVR